MLDSKDCGVDRISGFGSGSTSTAEDMGVWDLIRSPLSLEGGVAKLNGVPELSFTIVTWTCNAAFPGVLMAMPVAVSEDDVFVELFGLMEGAGDEIEGTGKPAGFVGVGGVSSGKPDSADWVIEDPVMFCADVTVVLGSVPGVVDVYGNDGAAFIVAIAALVEAAATSVAVGRLKDTVVTIRCFVLSLTLSDVLMELGEVDGTSRDVTLVAFVLLSKYDVLAGASSDAVTGVMTLMELTEDAMSTFCETGAVWFTPFRVVCRPGDENKTSSLGAIVTFSAVTPAATVRTDEASGRNSLSVTADWPKGSRVVMSKGLRVLSKVASTGMLKEALELDGYAAVLVRSEGEALNNAVLPMLGMSELETGSFMPVEATVDSDFLAACCSLSLVARNACVVSDAVG